MGVLPDINGMTDDQFKMWTAQKLVGLASASEKRDKDIAAIKTAISSMNWWNKGTGFLGGVLGGAAAAFGLKQTGG